MRYLFLLFLFFLIVGQVSAETIVKPLAPLPPEYGGGQSQLIPYIQNIFPFMIFLTAITAVGAMVWGGILYMTGGAVPSNLTQAKSWFWSALLGLLIVLGSVLILNTINPQILKLELPKITTPP